MGYHYYNYEAYIEKDKSYAIEDIVKVLSAFTIPELTAASITLSFQGWKLWLSLSVAEHVAEEAAEIGGIFKLPILQNCNARLEIYAEDDPGEVHYNDHLYVLEALTALEGVHIFDPVSGEFPYETVADESATGMPDTDFLELVEGNKVIELMVKKLRDNSMDGDKWHELGWEYNEAGKYELALRCYQLALDLHPERSMTWNNMGITYSNTGQTEKEIACFLKAIELNPHEEMYWNNLGLTYGAEGRLQEALQAFRKSLECDPEYVEAHLNLGYYLLLDDNPAEAFFHAEKAIALGNITNSSLNKGHVHLIWGQEASAVSAYIDSMHAFETEEAFWADYDSDFEVFGHYDISLEYYNSLKEKITTHIDTGFLEYVPGNDEINDYIAQLEAKGYDWKKWHNLGYCYGDLQMHDLAIRCYEVSVMLNADNAEGFYNIGRTHFESGRFLAGKEYLLKSIVLEPRNGDFLTTLGELYAEEDNRTKAMEYMEQAVELDPENEYSNANLGYYLLFYGEGEKALPYIEKSISLGGGDISFFNKGHLHFIRGEEREAVGSYAQSLSLYADEADFWQDFDADFGLLPQYGITFEKYNGLKDKIRAFRLMNDISLN